MKYAGWGAGKLLEYGVGKIAGEGAQHKMEEIDAVVAVGGEKVVDGIRDGGTYALEQGAKVAAVAIGNAGTHLKAFVGQRKKIPSPPPGPPPTAQDKVRVWSIQRVLFGLLLHKFTRPRLQAAAAARIQGQPDIFEAAKSGNAALVKDHFVADATSIHKRHEEYADPFVSFSKFLDESRIILPSHALVPTVVDIQFSISQVRTSS